MVCEKRIPLSTPTVHGDEMQYVQEAFDRNWIAPLGFNCDGFEEEMGRYLNKDSANPYHTLALTSGTSALHLAVKLAGVKPGDIVLCSDMTFAATVNPISYVLVTKASIPEKLKMVISAFAESIA